MQAVLLSRQSPRGTDCEVFVLEAHGIPKDICNVKTLRTCVQATEKLKGEQHRVRPWHDKATEQVDRPQQAGSTPTPSIDLN